VVNIPVVVSTSIVDLVKDVECAVPSDTDDIALDDVDWLEASVRVPCVMWSVDESLYCVVLVSRNGVTVLLKSKLPADEDIVLEFGCVVSMENNLLTADFDVVLEVGWSVNVVFILPVAYVVWNIPVSLLMDSSGSGYLVETAAVVIVKIFPVVLNVFNIGIVLLYFKCEYVVDDEAGLAVASSEGDDDDM